MRWIVLSGMALACAACSQEKAPAEQVAEVAEEIVAPTPKPSPLASGKWAPQDDCSEIEGAGPFRRLLAAAIEARDPGALTALAAEDVQLDFGGGAGRAELRRRLDEESTGLWEELDELMALGCSANEQGGITIPWFWDQDMGVDDPFMSMLVIGEDVPVYRRADPSAQRLGTVSWDVVEIEGLELESKFQKVNLPDDMTGYIASDKLRSLIDYRLIASSRNGRWRITSLIAGD